MGVAGSFWTQSGGAVSLVAEATKQGPNRWSLRLDCGHFATVFVRHVPAIGGRFNCGLCLQERDHAGCAAPGQAPSTGKDAT